MAISPQLPQIIIPSRQGALQTLALQAGQVLEAQIIGPAPSGGTQVQLAGQTLNLVLPIAVEAGATIKLEVQTSGGQIKLSLQPGGTPAPQTTPAQPLPLPSLQPALSLPPATSKAPVIQQSPQPTSSAQQSLKPVVQAPVAAAATPNTPASIAPAAPAAALQTPAQAKPFNAPAPALATPTSSALTSQGSAALASPVPLSAVQATPQVSNPAAPFPGATPSPYPPSQQRPVSAIVSGASAPTSQSEAQAQATTALPLAQRSNASASTSPQAALAQMVQSALPRQDSIASLLTALSSVNGKVALPEPVARAIGQLMGGRLVAESGKLDGAGLRQAVLNSGVFEEAHLMQGQMPAGQPSQKSSLLLLRQALTNWLGPQPPLTPAGQIAPPIRGQVPRSRSSEAPPVDPDAEPREVGKQLLERTEGSLARLRLHQNASLPDPLAKVTADWSMDLPVVVGGQQTVLHMAIHRDPEEKDQPVAERGWQMRFALSLPQLGEAGAQVSLRGGTTGVMLWAAERQTSDALEAHVMALRQTLAEVGLRPGAVIVRHGEPPVAAATAGHFLDERT